MKWTDSECLRLVELFNDGLTDEQIGMKIGRTAEAVRHMRKKMGLRRVMAPASKPVCHTSNEYLDCMDWPFPLTRPKAREITL